MMTIKGMVWRYGMAVWYGDEMCEREKILASHISSPKAICIILPYPNMRRIFLQEEHFHGTLERFLGDTWLWVL